MWVDDGAATNGFYVNVRLADGVVTGSGTVGSGLLNTDDGEVGYEALYLPATGVVRVAVSGKLPGLTTVRAGFCPLPPEQAAAGLQVSYVGTTADIIAAGSFQFEESPIMTSYVGHATTTVLSRAADIMTQMLLTNIPFPDLDGVDNDPASVGWNGNSYPVDQIVYYPAPTTIYGAGIFSPPKAYKSLVTTTVGLPPPDAPTQWVEIGSMNAWRMFDNANSSQTVAELTYEDGFIVANLKPREVVDTLILDNLDADYIRVRVNGTSYDDRAVYDKTYNLRNRNVTGWFDWFFKPFSFKKSLMITDLPRSRNAIITVIVGRRRGFAKCGTCIVGKRRQIGRTQYGAGVGIIDYSVKVERPYSKRMNVQVMISNNDLDAVVNLLASYRAVPIAWAAVSGVYNSMVMYGYYRQFESVIAYPAESQINFEIEGLT
jgi:hypothetical protein